MLDIPPYKFNLWKLQRYKDKARRFYEKKITEEPLAKLSVDSGRRKNTEVSILGGA